MTSSAELEALALRCEAASGPDRELDAEIAVALKVGCRANLPDDLEHVSMIRRDDHWAAYRKDGSYWFHCRSGTSMRSAEHYTATRAGRSQAAAAIRAIAQEISNAG